MLLLVGALVLMTWQGKQNSAREDARQPAQEQRQTPVAATTSAQQGGSAPVISRPDDGLVTVTPIEEAAAQERPDEQRPILENEFIKAELTSWGGAISRIVFKDYPAVQGEDIPYVFNAQGDVPALAIGRGSQAGVREYAPAYELVEATQDRVVFRREISPGVFFVRSYQLSTGTEGAAPYTIRHNTSIQNQTEGVVNSEPLYVSLGTAAPDAADVRGFNLNAGYYDGSRYDYENISKFTGGGVLFFKRDPIPYLERQDPVVWGAVKNQFFATILTPERPASSIFMKPVVFPAVEQGARPQRGITASMRFEIPQVQPGEQVNLAMDLYAGPKEYARLATLDRNQDEVMQFGWRGPGGGIISFIGKLFYTSLKAVQGLVVNWGVAIIILTVIIRLLFWPLTAKAADSSRRMAKLQEPMKALREKYKDNPRKLNEEMMAMWKKHKVNPMAGCLPILVQLPIFLSFYYMLRGASELRFAHFLWISDLSLPDTVAWVAGLPINILPLIMGVTMFYQMRLAPTPTVDATQAKIMRFMPLIFLFFCYNFSSGLVLYWTTSNVMSIFQQLHTNRKRRREEEAGEVELIVPEQEKPKPAHHGRAKVKSKRKA